MKGNLLIPSAPLHHSSGDWDYLKVADWTVWPNWSLSAEQFVSPPTSLRITAWPGNEDVYALSKHISAQDLKAGQIISWHRIFLTASPRIAFYIGVSAIDKAGIRIRPACYNLAWAKTILQWWPDFNEQCELATHIYYRTWVNDALVQTVHLYEKPLLHDINRVGVAGSFLSNPGPCYYDDTEIYMAVTP